MRKLVFAITLLFVFFNICCIKEAKQKKTYTDILPKEKGLILIKNLKSGHIEINTNVPLSKSYFKPGSLIKIISTYGILKEKLITFDETFKCEGHLIIGNENYNCWKYQGHGLENIESALADSCNLFFIKNTNRLGINKFRKYLNEFGIDIKRKTYFSNKELSELAIGESPYLYVTPLKILELISKIAVNNSKETKLLKSGLRKAVLIGTAKYLKDFKPEIAGKTGTSTRQGKKSFNQAWFIGYAPMDKPEISFVVFVKEGYSFSEAVPEAGRILKIYFNSCKR